MKNKQCVDREYSDLEKQSLKIQELKQKIRELHLENQTLRIELDYFLDFQCLINYTFLTCKKKIKQQILNLKINAKSFLQGKSGPNGYTFGENFEPYEVKIINPIKESRYKILHVIGNFYAGGSSQLIVDLIEHLGHEFEQKIVTRDLPATVAYLNVDMCQYELLTHPRQILPLLKSFKPDIIHAHYLGHHRDRYSELDWKWYNNIFQAAQECKIPIIENINIPTEPYISDQVRTYVYVSDYVRREFGYSNDPNITIYPGANLSTFSRNSIVSAPDDCIGMVYRLESDKLNQESIDVFIKVIQQRPQTKVLIVGGGRYLEFYQKKTEQAGVSQAFTFTGYVTYESLPTLFEKMSIFVAPVHTESFGQVSPFAMGFGIPVVGYDVGALSEITGNQELLIPYGDSSKLANLIIELLDNRARRLEIGKFNQQRASQLFTVEAMVESYRSLYKEVLETLEVSQYA